ncbi:hypothetical protein BJP34_03855 [Moorena producens PAL-8-15-08-1]|uniref:Uncharacterized protein n=1 Tax=Moorena producens PAL-8-15-08-1 TaxID=1458985 RepID=A0A1D8TM69_9CYAN|nr:hypothetical protein BJP34_03855 [Moorena producens PAL-8-15-08-1]
MFHKLKQYLSLVLISPIAVEKGDQPMQDRLMGKSIDRRIAITLTYQLIDLNSLLQVPGLRNLR